MKIFELFTDQQPSTIEWHQDGDENSEEYEATFHFDNIKVDLNAVQQKPEFVSQWLTQDATELRGLDLYDKRIFEILFAVDGGFKSNNKFGSKSSVLFEKIVSAYRSLFLKIDWDIIIFSGSKEDGGRNKLYTALAHRLSNQINGKFIQHKSLFFILKD